MRSTFLHALRRSGAGVSVRASAGASSGAPAATRPNAWLALLAAFALGCAGGDDTPSGEGTAGPAEVSLLESPAPVGSAEPNLSPTDEGALLSWLEPAGEDLWSLRIAEFGDDGFGPPRTVVTGDDLFVNWADFPSVIRLADGRLAAHWLQRGEAGGYDYGVRVALSADGGETWSEPWTPHEDGTPTEHGFVSMWSGDDGTLGVLWLDGRRYADGPTGPATHEMALRHRVLAPDGTPGPEIEVDGRICDCCQTSVARTAEGWVAVYRDRAADEVRDIYAARLVDGAWSDGRPVHRDGWVIDACPVNGPSVAAAGDRVAAAWFTAASDVSRVEVAFSDDGGRYFREPVRVDGGAPIGRVDVLVDASGDALVTWLESTAEGGEVRLRRVPADATSSDDLGAPVTVARTGAARASGFPRMTMLPDGRVLVAWTRLDGDETAVRVGVLEPPAS